MSRLPRRLFLTLALLVLGAVLGHAAEHEGWISGLFHCESCQDCPDSRSACPAQAGCECHVHDDALATPPVPPAVAPLGVQEIPPLYPFCRWIAARPLLAPPLLDLPALPPSRARVNGSGPLLI